MNVKARHQREGERPRETLFKVRRNNGDVMTHRATRQGFTALALSRWNGSQGLARTLAHARPPNN